eukprot:Colp12_sorted_trinity150504_noHs@5922
MPQPLLSQLFKGEDDSSSLLIQDTLDNRGWFFVREILKGRLKAGQWIVFVSFETIARETAKSMCDGSLGAPVHKFRELQVTAKEIETAKNDCCGSLLEKIKTSVAKCTQNEKVTVVLGSLSPLLLCTSLKSVMGLLRGLAAPRTFTLSLLHTDLHDDVTTTSLHHASSSSLSLLP